MNLQSGLLKLSSSFTRPANTTAYAAGDVVANNTVSSSVTPLSFRAFSAASQLPAIVKRVMIDKSTSVTASATFKVHFFAASTINGTSGDNSPLIPLLRAKYLGSVSVATAQAFADGAAGWGQVPAAEAPIVVSNNELTDGTVYALIEALAAYAPGDSEVFRVTVEFVPKF